MADLEILVKLRTHWFSLDRDRIWSSRLPALPWLSPASRGGNFPDLTLVDPHLKNGYAHSYFAGVQHRLGDNLTLEVNGLGTYGRRLITTDVVNRDFTLPSGRINPNLPDIAYRAAEGFSNYNALTAVARYR